ncbi:NAD-dependent epimerase/dehydratase family protein [Bradyrhizobium sp. 168]|uniref:NAD-dependent epimerase/dehydratase family protein n=1 Tax=unclassified Bradyrhizobium TaxID=2631580 RepID=UPI001FFAB525|nr:MULTISPECIES: NAD-dependent epimerase/dehydratase family protein [unclassified Bradyrhizobium]MCK1583017.1 NAD-dependent epimerase/dehydratase family protein [Bradyrhizobium sp. 168]UPK13922.1 NAD-dependent epimerase/dehydratase family protein [Bradyrhizobium sp. 155]UPK17163.1 NAD-dependent epimerase/dehydratase family protein [Bradyrhizobium sp. 131]
MNERKPVVLVTGASGFVGRHVVPALAREGWSIRRAVRRPEGIDDEVVIETIGPETDWQAALQGVDAVVHLAARVHHKHEEHAVQLYRNVNIAGTLQLAHSAATAGVRQFIFISTVLVHGRSNDGRAPFSEDDVLTPRGLYGMSKAAAEAGLKTLARDSAMKISVIRPPLVYGAGAKGNFALLTRAVNLGLPLPFAAIRNHRAFLAVQNLSSFIVQRLSHPDPASNFEIFLVADREQVSTSEFVARLAKAAGKNSRLFGMPPDLLGTLLRVMGRPDTQDSLIGSLELNLSKAIATGWQPPVSLDEGLRLALAAQDA